MKWFPGTVNTAIQISRQNQALLIVYIETEDENGKKMNELWKDIDPQNIPVPTVGIKLKKGETPAQQFAEIYPTPILPAAYFIDLNNKPIEIITCLIDLDNDTFRSRLNRAALNFLASHPQSEKKEIEQLQQNEQIRLTAQAELKEKLQRAKELIEAKKKRDAEKKIEEEKLAEKLRVKNAKSVQEAKKEREEKELIEAAKQRAREKLETERERERVRAQIKADREDAEYRRQRNIPKNETEVKKDVPNVPKSIPSDRCRIQVRLPDGSILIEEFPSNDLLHSLIEIIKSNETVNDEFELSQLYPKRIFTAENFEKSYLENCLTPSSSLIVKNKTSNSLKNSIQRVGVVGNWSWILLYLLSPFNFVFNLINSFFKKSGESKKSENSEAGSSQNVQQTRGMPRSAEVRQRGNVAGLHNPNEDDPEERASYNGNSTQFM